MINRTIVILGATCDLGRELSFIYAKNNFDLVLISRNKKKNLELKALIEDKFSNIDVTNYELDILNYNNHFEIYNSIKKKPDGVISLIGFTHNVNKINDENILNVINTNYSLLVKFLTYFLIDFERQNNGFLICISSVAGLRGRAKNFIYGSAKAALNEFLSGCRNYYNGSNLHIMTVLPGFIQKSEDINDKRLLSIKPSKLALKIFNAQQKRKEILYSSILWWLIMIIIRFLPNRIFKKIKF